MKKKKMCLKNSLNTLFLQYAVETLILSLCERYIVAGYMNTN